MDYGSMGEMLLLTCSIKLYWRGACGATWLASDGRCARPIGGDIHVEADDIGTFAGYGNRRLRDAGDFRLLLPI